MPVTSVALWWLLNRAARAFSLSSEISRGRGTFPSENTDIVVMFIFGRASKIHRYLNLNLAWTVRSICCFNLTRAISEAMTLGFSMMASEYRLLNSGEVIILCMLQSTNVSKDVERRLLTLFWLPVSDCSNTLFTAFSTCARLKATMKQAKCYSLLKRTKQAGLVLFENCSEMARLAYTRYGVSCSSISPLGRWASFWASIPAQLFCRLFERFWWHW